MRKIKQQFIYCLSQEVENVFKNECIKIKISNKYTHTHTHTAILIAS